MEGALRLEGDEDSLRRILNIHSVNNFPTFSFQDKRRVKRSISLSAVGKRLNYLENCRYTIYMLCIPFTRFCVVGNRGIASVRRLTTKEAAEKAGQSLSPAPVDKVRLTC